MKRKAIFIIFFLLFFIIFIFSIYTFYLLNNSIIISYESENNSIIDITERILENLKIRNIEKSPFLIDRILEKYYPIIFMKERDSFDDNFYDNDFFVEKFYGVVDITDDIFFIENNNNLDENIKFLKKSELNLYKRILLEYKSGKPLIKNRITYYEIRKNFLINKNVERIKEEFKKFSYKEKKVFILGFSGDFTFEYYLKKEIKKNGVGEVFKEIKDILKVPDIMSVNLECVISESNKKEPKRYTFKGTEDEFKIFIDSGIDYFACANNHAMDFGEESLIDTINILDKYNYKHSGTGKNIGEAITPAIMTLDNWRLAYFSIAEVPTEMRGYEVMRHFTATDKKPGIANYNKDILAKKIKEEKDKGSIVIVQFHTGTEYALEPLLYTKKWVKEIIDMGANTVICHHPHVINGVEIYNEKLIAYSLGDFLLYITNDFADESIILYLFLDDGKILSFAFFPTACYYGKFNMNKDKIFKVGKRFIELTKRLN